MPQLVYFIWLEKQIDGHKWEGPSAMPCSRTTRMTLGIYSAGQVKVTENNPHILPAGINHDIPNADVAVQDPSLVQILNTYRSWSNSSVSRSEQNKIDIALTIHKLAQDTDIVICIHDIINSSVLGKDNQPECAILIHATSLRQLAPDPIGKFGEVLVVDDHGQVLNILTLGILDKLPLWSPSCYLVRHLGDTMLIGSIRLSDCDTIDSSPAPNQSVFGMNPPPKLNLSTLNIDCTSFKSPGGE